MFDNKGFVFIDSLIALSILLIGVLALGSLFVFATNVSNNNKIKTIAAGVAGQEIEKIKSLQYSDVGLISGNPPGLLQHDTYKTVNGIAFKIKTQIRWVDDIADGLTPQDSDPRDYKQATIDISWQIRNTPGSFKLSTAIAKESEDQIAQGGNIDVIVKDTAGNYLQDVKVEVTTGPSSPISDWTDEAGKVFFAMLQASQTIGDYSLVVSKTGYIVRPDLVLQTTTIANGETRSLEFIMAKPGSLVVNLVDPLGNIIQKQSKLTLNNPDAGQVKFNQANGYFDIQELFPGNWEIVPYATSYEYTGAPITVEILPNNSTEVTITMTPRPQGYLKLNIYDGVTSNTIPNVDVKITNIDSSDTITAQTDSNGMLYISLEIGTYDITAEKAGYIKQTHQATIYASAETTLGYYLDQAPSFGSVLVKAKRRRNGRPRANVWVRVVGQSYDHLMQTDSQGEALFSNITPGDYIVYRWRSGWRYPRNINVSAGQQAKVVYKY